MAVTQKDIAQRVGVSQQAVAHALSGKGRLSEATRARILEEATALGYRPNPLARALLTGKTHLVALWMPHLLSPFYARVAHAVEHLLRDSPYDLIITGIEGARSEAEDQFASASWPVDGILAFESFESPELAPRTDENGAPIVSMGARGHSESDTLDLVTVDLRSGAEDAVRHLMEKCSRVAFLSVSGKHQARDARYAAYCSLMQTAGREPEFIVVESEPRMRPVTRQAIRTYVQQHGCPDGIFCSTDEEAIGTYRGLRDLGLRVPQDVALVGCDGIEDGEYLDPTLSTIVQPIDEMCRIAWETLQQRIENADAPRRHVELQARLEIRESSRQA